MRHLPPAQERLPQAAAVFPSHLSLAGSPEVGTGDTRTSEALSSYIDLQGKVLLREAWDRYL